MANAKCIACGSSGYQGLAIFECSKFGCENYRPVNNPPQSQSSLDFFKSVTKAVASGGMPTAPAMQAIFFSSYLMQMKTGVEFLNILHNGANGFQPLAGNAGMIAGGAPRDWWFGERAKDIDIYVEYFDEDHFKKAFSMIPITKKSKKSSGYSPSFGVWDVIYNAELFQIISVQNAQTIESHVDSFDFGINKVMMDRAGTTIETPAFTKDIANHTLTCEIAKLDVKTLANFGKRTALMKSKFPGWTIDIV